MMTVSKEPQSHRQETKVSEIPVVELKSSSSLDAVSHEVIEAMKLAGVCIVRNLLDQRTVDKIRQEILPYEQDLTAFERLPTNTYQISGLLSKSPTYAHSIVGNEIFTATCNHFLTSTYECWLDQGSWVSVQLPPQLDFTMALYIDPGSTDQPLHRDDSLKQNWNTAASEYVLGRDLGCGVFVALTESAREHGTTRFIPGSHLWDYQYDYPSSDDPRIRYAEMHPGDAYFFLNSVTHGGSANYTTDYRRVLVGLFATRNHLRQTENQFLTYDLETVRTFPEWLQRFMGYNMSELVQGWVNKEDPLLLVNKDTKEDRKDGCEKMKKSM